MNTIFDAIKAGDVDQIWEILSHNPEQLNLLDIYGSSALHYVSSRNMTYFVDMFLQKNIDINIENSRYMTPLFFASAAGALQTVRLLISKGANIDCPNLNFATPLFMAARNGHLKIVEALIRAGSDTHLVNIHGVSAYDIACARGHREIADMIVKLSHIYGVANTDINTVDNVVYIENYFDNPTDGVVNG